MQDTPSTAVQSTTQTPGPLVRHTRRQQWGRALMVWERDGKRGYQFEDGELRVFAEKFFGLLQPAAKPDPVLRHQLREQAREAGELPDALATKRGGKVAGPTPTLDDQITVFEQLVPDGFHGVMWSDKHRIRVDGKPLKRHRDAAIARAKEQLDQVALQALVDAGDYQAVMTRVVDVAGSTDLATNKQLEVLVGLTVDEELASAMVGFLHDQREGDLATMARLRRALAKHGVRKVAWQVLTAPRSLLYPNDHMCVRPSAVRAQAKLLMPNFKPGAVPCAEDYARALELAMTVRAHLTRAGFSPRDLFDVTAFMQETTSKSASESLVEAMVLRQAAAAVPPVESSETSAAEVVASAQ